jgi:hypothetical protein
MTQNVVWRLLVALAIPPPSYSDPKILCEAPHIRLGNTCGDADSYRFPDLVWVVGKRLVILEIDEDSHYAREISCELAVNNDYFSAAQARGYSEVVILRFNPDAYDGGHVALEDRCREVVRRVHASIASTTVASDRATVEYLYYHSRAVKKHVGALRRAIEKGASFTCEQIGKGWKK